MLSPNFLSQLERFMVSLGYTVFPHDLNIAVLEGSNPDGTLNKDTPDRFNDLIIVWDYLEGKPRLRGTFVCTCEPGRFYTDKPLNPKGAARIALGQYTAWAFGYHQNKKDHEALVQVRPVTVHRDRDRNMVRTGDNLDTGLFGINIHHGYNTPVGGSIGRHSAGCTVVPSVSEFRKFLSILKSTSRYKRNPKCLWTVAYLSATDFKDWREGRGTLGQP